MVNRSREFRFGRCQCGEGSREGEGEFGDEVCGHVGGGEAWSGLSYAADFGTFEIEAVAEEGEHLLDVLIEGADDLLPEAGGAEASLAFEAARGVGLVEEDADPADDGSLSAEVDGALSAAVAPGESVVGSEPPSAGDAPGGDDGALPSEEVGVVGEEADGWVLFCTLIHAYSIANRRDFSIQELNTHDWGGCWISGLTGGMTPGTFAASDSRFCASLRSSLARASSL